MSKEELLQTLRDSGLQDEEIKNLLNEALQCLDNPECEKMPEETDNEADMAGDLLGVKF